MRESSSTPRERSLSKQIIPWHDLFLEGQLVHLPALKSHYRKDAALSSDVPIFCTAKEEISFVKGGVLDATESEMTGVRWNVFHFHREISKDEQVEAKPCPRCFAELILQVVHKAEIS